MKFKTQESSAPQGRTQMLRGFTIVELLIVVVVIAILVAIVTVAYRGIQARAADAVLRTDLNSLAKQLEYTKVDSGGVYPANKSSLSWSAETTVQYTYYPNTNGFCLTASNVQKEYYITNENQTPQEGVCTGHISAHIDGFIALTVGGSVTCGVNNERKAYCWGESSSVSGGGGASLTPAAVYMDGVLSGKQLAMVGSSSSTACALDTDGKAYCWGSNQYGYLGVGANPPNRSFYPVAVDTSGVLSGKTLTKISTGGLHSCVIDTDGKAYCWGRNIYGYLGNGVSGSANDAFSPVAVDTSGVLAGKTLSDIIAGSSVSCALDTDGKAYCWGLGSSGQLGRGSKASSSVPVAVDTTGVISGKPLVKIDSDSHTTCALDSDGKAYCWGGYKGMGLGINANDNVLLPIAVDTSGVLSGKTLIDLSIGDSHVCVVDTQGKAYCWGYGGSGQLGDGNSTNALTPVAVDDSGALAGKTLIDIDAGAQMTCAIDSEGKAYCWGSSYYGRLGDGSTAGSPVPVAVDMSGV